MAEGGESYVRADDKNKLQYVKNRSDSYEVVQNLASIDSTSTYKLRLLQPNKPSSSITPYQPLYRILQWVEMGDEERASKIQLLENECRENISMVTEASKILKVHSHFATDKGFAIILPSCRFSLFMLRNYQAFLSGFEEWMAAFILSEVLKSLCHLHARHTHHGSINTESIYLNSTGSVLVGYRASLFKDAVVPRTPWVEPPEVRHRGPHNELSDVWQFGLLALELVYPPDTCRTGGTRLTDHLQKLRKVYDLPSKNASALIKGKAKISKAFKKAKTFLGAKKKAKGPFDDKGKTLSRSFAKMILQCMEEDPRDRPTVQELKEWKCFKGLIEQEEFWEFIREAIAEEPEPQRSY